MTGYRTLISIILSILGGLGVFEKLGLAQTDVANVLDLILSAAAGLAALYFNYRNHQNLERAGLR